MPCPFIDKLYIILNSNDPSISWSSCGTYIEFCNTEELKTLLKKYFKTDRITSLMKQLNLYGFKKTRKFDGKNYSYRHNFFNRNTPKKMLFLFKRNQTDSQFEMLFRSITSPYSVIKSPNTKELVIKPAPPPLTIFQQDIIPISMQEPIPVFCVEDLLIDNKITAIDETVMCLCLCHIDNAMMIYGPDCYCSCSN